MKIGERENRIYSSIVRSKYMGFGHGIGRSGNLNDAQPKSVGNCLLGRITTHFLIDLIKNFGIRSCNYVAIFPYATGMCISTCLLYLRQSRPESEYVIISRLDHKTCYKCITFCNLKYFVVDMIMQKEELCTDIKKIEQLIKNYGKKICCILSHTSSYAPRNCDDLLALSYLCRDHDIPHVINNSFGLQCDFLCKEIQKCFDQKGRIDFVVQSCDKNWLVPVNGGIVFGSNKKKVEELKKTYPGRLPINAYLDLFITLLELGKYKIMEMRKQRRENYEWLKKEAEQICNKYNLELIKMSKNKLSIGINLNGLYKYCGIDNPKIIGLIGSMLYYRNVTGHRVICSPLLFRKSLLKKNGFLNEEEEVEHRLTIQKEGILNSEVDNNLLNDSECKVRNEEELDAEFEKLNKKNQLVIGNHTFNHFGAGCDTYPYSYISFSCVIGIEKKEMKHFISRLDAVLNCFIKKFTKKEKQENVMNNGKA